MNSTATSAKPAKSISFSLRDILVAVVALAVGFSIWRLPKGDWIDIPVWALSFYFVMSLLRHAAATRRRLIDHPALPNEQRWGGRLQIAILMCFAGILVGACALRGLAANGRILKQPDSLVFDFVQLQHLPRDLAILAMLAAIGLSHRRTIPKQSVRTRQSVYFVIAIAVVLVGFMVYEADRAFIAFLVYLAVSGIELSQSARLLPAELNISNTVRAQRFMFDSLAGLLLLILNLLFIAGLVKWWTIRRRRLIFLILLAGGLAAECWLAFRIASRDVWILSREMAEAIVVSPFAVAIAVALIVVGAVAVLWPNLTQRAILDRSDGASSRHRFLHEGWIGGLLLGSCAMASVLQQWFSDFWQVVETPYWRSAQPLDLQNIFYILTLHPTTCILLAASIGGLSLAFTRWRAADVTIADALLSTNPAQFAVALIGLVIAFIAGAPVLAAASFSFWFVRFGKAF